MSPENPPGPEQKAVPDSAPAVGSVKGPTSWERELQARTADMNRLLENIKARLAELEKLLDEVTSHWHAEDGFYRFYHQSFKVYRLQDDTERVIRALRALLPERPLNSWFEEIVKAGTGKQFQMDHNQRWLQETRPILEAFFHARTMLEFAIRYGKELERAPNMLPSGWAAVLYLYDLR